jgi:NAD(P)-dependent dehydrogenase (short-subunit alcohol dehydrogenase family)
VALVTGASRGIGYAVAAALTARGARVAITGRDERRLKEARDRLAPSERPTGPPRVLAIRGDVREAGDAQSFADQTVAAFGGLDILVNNAGVGRFGEVADMPLEEWREVVETNLSGVFYCTRAAIPHLRRRGGWIINISSLAGINPFAGGAAYCASKAGLDAFTEALMQEVRHDGIRVATVAPGSVATPFAGRTGEEGADWKLSADDVARVIVDLVVHPPRSLPSRVELRPARPRK